VLYSWRHLQPGGNKNVAAAVLDDGDERRYRMFVQARLLVGPGPTFWAARRGNARKEVVAT
jgi:hypothetical protein